jgi:DNA polymerase-4
MDAFYASVEQRDDPDLRGKPIAVGGSEHRGVTTTASYEARKFGVRSAMPGWKAKQLCPQLIFVKPRFDVYYQVSRQIREIFRHYTDLIEPLAFDEAFLDVTKNKKDMPYAMEVAQAIMAEVKAETELTCSAGVSYCKFLAKVASGHKKPNGLTIIRPQQAEAFLEALPIEKFFGVGKVTAEKMKNMGIENGADLKRYTKIELAQRFGKMGRYYYDIVRGMDKRPVQPDRVRKSIGVERTFDTDLVTFEEIEKVLHTIIEKLMVRLEKNQNFGRTLTLKLKTPDFKIITRSSTSEHFLKDKEEITKVALSLLENHFDEFESIRLLGLTSSQLMKEEQEKGGNQLEIEWKD